MNIRQEKEYIYKMLEEVNVERNKLTDVALSLVKRLEMLDEVERLALVTKAPVEPVRTEKPLVQTITKNVPEEENVKTLTEIIKKHNEQFLDTDEEDVAVREKSIVPKLEIERELDKLPKNKPLSNERATSLIVTILKDAGQPMKAKELLERLKEMTNHKITSNNFNSNILPRAIKKNSNIERATFGYYQYRTKSTV